jgi:MFS family permease
MAVVGPTLPLLRARRTSSCGVENSIEPCPSACAGYFDSTAPSKAVFTAMSFSNVFQGLVFFLPNFFIPCKQRLHASHDYANIRSAYATTIGLSTIEGTIILSVTNVTIMASQIVIGSLADRSNPLVLMFASTLLSALVSLCLWGFSENFFSYLEYSTGSSLAVIVFYTVGLQQH